MQSGDYITSFVNQSINAVPLCLPQHSKQPTYWVINSRSQFLIPKRQLLSFVQLAAARSTFRILMSTAVTTAGINYHTQLTTINYLLTTPLSNPESLSCFKLARHLHFIEASTIGYPISFSSRKCTNAAKSYSAEGRCTIINRDCWCTFSAVLSLLSDVSEKFSFLSLLLQHNEI